MSHYLFWAIGAFGIGGAILIVVGFVVGWPVLIAFFSTKIGRYVLAAGAVIAGVAVALGKAKQAGRAEQIAKQEKENADFLKEQAKRDVAIAGSTDAALDDRLREHPRKPGARP